MFAREATQDRDKYKKTIGSKQLNKNGMDES